MLYEYIADYKANLLEEHPYLPQSQKKWISQMYTNGKFDSI